MPGVKIIKMGTLDDTKYIESLGDPELEIYTKHMAGWEKNWPGAQTKEGGKAKTAQTKEGMFSNLTLGVYVSCVFCDLIMCEETLMVCFGWM